MDFNLSKAEKIKTFYKFLYKISKIPNNKWTIATLKNDENQCCLLGHFGVTVDNFGNYEYTYEAELLAHCLSCIPDDLYFINDRTDYLGSPKGRVLVAIKDEIKALLREDNED